MFAATTRTFTKVTLLSEQGRGAAWHVLINARHGRGTAWARHAVCELSFTEPLLSRSVVIGHPIGLCMDPAVGVP